MLIKKGFFIMTSPILPPCSGDHPHSHEEVAAQLTDDLTLVYMAERFQCFADPTRLKIINALMIKELCVCDLTMIMQMTQPAVSHHLKQLRQLRLVKSRREGKSTFYSLDDHHIPMMFDLCKLHLNEKSDPAAGEVQL
ncbi:MAG: helix-turn-helix transcriptional regulator [Lentisphaerae bacterium]|nr:helix-turn-helix transcriptional regulator [Lentisphaerota bacterium]